MDGWGDVRFASYRHALLRRRQRGRLVLIGDAAHPMSPHLGQGITSRSSTRGSSPRRSSPGRRRTPPPPGMRQRGDDRSPTTAR
ncbi:MAG: hypothetical protein HOQ03_07480 [Thermoleophilia bacterium]|nr:hypothetical protein [Thermoleophilia bacterium]